MDWNTLLSVAVGGLIAVIPVVISNRFQAKEREKDRLEQRRDAKMQTIEKSLGGDIDKIISLLANMISVMSEQGNYDYKKLILDIRKKGLVISEDEYKRELNSQIELLTTQTEKVITLVDSIGGLIYSFDEEISSEFDKVMASHYSFINSIQPDGTTKGWDEVLKSAGNLQRILREKRISIRNFEE